MMESQASSFDKISSTALMVAYARQFTDIPYSKELAQLVNAKTIVEQLLANTSEEPVEVAVLIEGHYKAINQVMAETEATQIIELASGLLPRGMAISQNPNITFVESDLPAMISRKQALVKQLIGHRPNLHLIAIDATHQPSQFPLHVDYLHQGEPLVIISEGLLMYLTLAEKQQVFANVREILQMYGGVWITPDLVTKEDLNQQRSSPVWQKLGQMLDNITSRSLLDNYFENFNHLEHFVSKQGFCFKKHSLLNMMDQLTCLEPLGIGADVAKSVLATSSIFTLSVQTR